MPSIFRSEDVEFCQLIVPTEYVYNIVRSIGELGMVQFIDKNEDVAAFSRRFTPNIVWCEDLWTKLKFFEAELKKEKAMPIEAVGESLDAPDLNQFYTLENEINSLYVQLRDSSSHLSELCKSYRELMEYRHVLRHANKVYKLDPHESGSIDSETAIEGDRSISALNGLLPQSNLVSFQQFLWRATKGNIIFRHVPIEDDIRDNFDGETVPKCVFFMYLQGEQLLARARVVCEAFKAVIYPFPASEEEQREISVGLMARIKDIEMVINQTREQRKSIVLQACKNILYWKNKVLKIKAIYVTMNMFCYDGGSRALIAECWIPSVYVEKVRATIETSIGAGASSGVPTILNVVSTTSSPPTYFQANKVTSSFQNLVDAYGVPKYKEVNPALYMVITFPFLFAIMFGDFGHGILLTCFGLYMVLREKVLMKYKNNEMFGMIIGGRYIILLMGIFSIYTGLIYNDVFSKSVAIFPSGWSLPTATSKGLTINDVKALANISTNTLVTLDPQYFAMSAPYPFGIDPMWMFAWNKIPFLNSFKMKMSMVLGILQMTFGIILRAVNNCYYGHISDIYFEFIPQIIFFFCFFGYLVFLIFYKWLMMDYSTVQPSILLALLGMVMDFGKPISDENKFYTHQETVETVLTVVACICVPWMLIPKPLYLLLKHKREQKRMRLGQERYILTHTPLSTTINEHENAGLVSNVSQHSDDGRIHTTTPHFEEFNFGEIFVLQVIHTIEFVLGTISNTASYLRLWALSLAHAELSEVLWNMTLQRAFSTTGYVGSVVIFGIYLFFTILMVCILIIMEGLSAFLHALRLHWVEFQNKFYSGTGSPLAPLSLNDLVETGE